MENKIIVMPEDINMYNGQSTRCDMLVRPCSCGTWHHIEDWRDSIEVDKAIKKLKDG